MQQIAKSATEFVFPYRIETMTVLNELSKTYPSWKLQYYKALNHWALNQKEESRKIFSELGDTPDNAYFYSARKELMQDHDNYVAVGDLTKALELNKSALNYHNLSLYACKRRDNKIS